MRVAARVSRGSVLALREEPVRCCEPVVSAPPGVKECRVIVVKGAVASETGEKSLF
jgi:hypothetical protein